MTFSDKRNVSAAEPSIGQKEYLKYLRIMNTVQKPSYLQEEWKLASIDIGVLERTVTFFLERHESLRTIFPLIDEEIKQVVLPTNDDRFKIEYVNIPGNETDFSDIRKAHLAKATEVFADIEQGPLVKFVLFKYETGYIFFVLIHHIICDAWSTRIIRQEVTRIYLAFAAGSRPVLPPMTSRLRDYCENQNTWLRQNKDALSSFWKQRLRGFDKEFDMIDFRRAYASRTGRKFSIEQGGPHTFTFAELSKILDSPDCLSYTRILSGDAFQDVMNLAVSAKYQLSSLVYASLFLVLHAYTGKKKLLVPALVADRFISDFQPVIGCLLGSVYFPVDVDENKTIREFIKEVQKEAFLLFSERQLIFSHSFLDLNGDYLRNCCDMYVNFHGNEQEISDVKDTSAQHLEESAVHYPIYCKVEAYNNALAIVWKYNKHLFNREMIEDIAGYYEDLLKYMVANVDKKIRELIDFCRTLAMTS